MVCRNSVAAIKYSEVVSQENNYCKQFWIWKYQEQRPVCEYSLLLLNNSQVCVPRYTHNSPHNNNKLYWQLEYILRKSCDRDSSRRPKKRLAKLHYITRHVRNGCHLILATMLSRHERCGCNEHFNMKRSRRQDSDAVYGVWKFNLSRNLWNFEICYFRLRMLSSSFCFL